MTTDQEKQSSQKVISELISGNAGNKSNFENENISNLKKKISALEEKNLSNLKSFNDKINEYDEKIKKMQVLFEHGVNNNLTKQQEKKIEEMLKENLEIKSRYENIVEKEKSINSENLKLKEKLKKYKRNYTELLDKEKEAKTNTLIKQIPMSGKNSEIYAIANKIEEIEQRNKDREEHYKQLCINANSQQINKELEFITKKFENEKKELTRSLNQKNAELLEIRRDFQDILNELEELKRKK
jgi:hypothetical protein